MKTQYRDLELWGGVECTINRVGDRYFNQLLRNGHWHRLDDIDLIANLGVRTLRFPILWESIAPRSLEEIDWSWPDARLKRLRELGIRPIVGLLHHGSGPRYTSLMDPALPEKLAFFAARVAQRYPWIDLYTPINEPLTTARFSGLYGHWYPHARDNGIYIQMLLNQCRGIVLAMRAIREINAGAKLVQTEDLGRTFSTPKLRYQAHFENQRRWLTWDLLSGAVDPAHVIRSYLSWVGTPSRDIDFFAANPCPPDIVGINYYVTSERYLDENVESYPRELHGHNGRHLYADDAAVRARPLGIAGVRASIIEAHQRYGVPIALTEVHLGCSLDEQIRWFMEAWQSARICRERGVNVWAVTAWALFGSFDWNTLVTQQNGHYEPGAFDVEGVEPRATALAVALQTLAREGRLDDPLLDAPGWWRRRSRLRFPTRQDIAA